MEIILHIAKSNEEEFKPMVPIKHLIREDKKRTWEKCCYKEENHINKVDFNK